MTARTDTDWPVTWSEVEDVQLRDWLRTTPAQRLAWLEKMLEFARTAGALSKPGHALHGVRNTFGRNQHSH